MTEVIETTTAPVSAEVERFLERLQQGERGGHFYVALLGLKTFDTEGLLSRIKKGLSYRTWERFVRASMLSKEELSRLVQIPARTLSRRKEEGRLHPDESDRLLRAARVFATTLALFEGNMDNTRRWLTSPLEALGNATPLDYAASEVGARELEFLIGRLEHGIPS